ncbi:alpha-ketoacid dehydrogenase subunit beta [Pelotomaculum propionicicum]|uniref:Pyruvate dehydrogenase E1 component subunit beta n=1 Tax=Pelotomaculum propionicicum TaxID=258475 RepID=A0A4Y7RSC2_9FIRM|nr:alpha-ketoacid dehydrogenase subunit beta [Pelotomaculum propionicicum]NLI13028.1 alpha-ketoacid dehydrogenase subunit beta [Peptococcaceae bacterium]TEB11924.1 Pyruvate dehydrogenase E1 component subunit beta [Pelotomaculum propionicicum]
MQQITMGQAVRQALAEEMQRDPNVFLAGEGIGVGIHESPVMPTFGLLREFGPDRVKDTPVSEAAIAGLAVGASVLGLRPVVEVMFNPFFTLASDQIVNHAAKLRYLSGGKSSFPMVVRVKTGAGFGAGCQHSHNLEAWAAHCPGLKVVMPGTAADAKGLLKSAIRDDNPVVFIEDMGLYFFPTPVPEGEYTIPIGVADIKRPGRDVTVVTWSKMLGVAFKAAAILSKEGIEVEILDLRTLLPLDKEAIITSLKKTGRLVILHEATRTGGFGGEIAALAVDEAFSYLKAPVKRVTGPDIPVPFSPPLEQFYIPDEHQLVEAVKSVVL